MKKKIFFIAIGFTLALTACKKDEPAPIAKVEIEDNKIEASYHDATVTWKITANATVGEAVVEYALDSAFTKFEQEKMSLVNPKAEDHIYSVILKHLTEGKQYFLRCRVINKVNSYVTNFQTFKTKAYQLANVRTDSVTGITVASAILHATLLDRGTDSIPQVGFCVATHKNVKISDACLDYSLMYNKDSVAYAVSLDKLSDNTTYYVRAYAKNSRGVSYGEEISFATIEIVAPQVGSTTISDITYTTAIATSEVLIDGGSSVIERGICYSTSPNPTISNSKIASGSGTGSFSCSLSNLTAGTTYYVRAYATNTKGTSYGEETSFITTAYGLPALTTSAATNISYTTATCGGNVTADGGQSVTERGICYSTTQNPTIANNNITSGSGTGSFFCSLAGLAAGQKYYVRAYATNSIGTSYGDEVSFTTTAYAVPTVTTSSATKISYTSATCGGNVTADGGQSITERGICYSTSPNPTISNSKIASGSTLGSFTCNLTELTADKKYYVRAYASNSKGISYGNEVSFTTTAYRLPTVTTSAASDISYTSATCGGNVTADGGQSVTERGICYSTTQNPTIANNKFTCGSGTGSFSCSLSNLTAGTTYYVRAYATNTKGTSYGTQIICKTLTPSLPIVQTDSVTMNDGVSLMGYGRIVSNGGVGITQYGFCWNTMGNPTIDNTRIAQDGEVTTFSLPIPGISKGKTYYVCAFAKNSQGVGYGQTQSFTVPQDPYIENVSASKNRVSMSTLEYYLSVGFYVIYSAPIEVYEVGYYVSCSREGLTDTTTIATYVSHGSYGSCKNLHRTCELLSGNYYIDQSYTFETLYGDYIYSYMRPYIITNIGKFWFSIYQVYKK